MQSNKATVTFHPDYRLSQVDPRIYGSFVEHMSRCVYTGIYEPEHLTADDMGFRGDVLELTKQLRCPVMRYPGGNFLSGYNWEDGVGPKADRPRKLDLAWFAVETNQMGTDEFMEWAKRADTAPMMAVNLGTRGPDAARNLLEYVNFPGGSHYSDLRINNGHKEPYNVKLWCLGNEMDGPWQIGHKTAEEYGRTATETAKLMKWVDPSIELVACGSSSFDMDTYGRWEYTVLDHCYEHVEYISLHSYFSQEGGDLQNYLLSGEKMNRYIEGVIATCDAIRSIKHGKKDIMLSFDEWNVSNRQRTPETPKWAEVRAIGEAVYTREDAMAVGGLMISLLKHADRVKVACQAQLANLLGLIMTRPGGGAWRQTIFYPFQLMSQYGRGDAMRPALKSPKISSKLYEQVDALDMAAVRSEDGREFTLFVLNRDAQNPVALECDLRAMKPASVIEQIGLSGSGDDINDEGNEAVYPITIDGALLAGGMLFSEIPAGEWRMIRVAL